MAQRKPSFFLAYEPELFSVGHPRLFFRTVCVVLPLAALFCSQAFARVTGISRAAPLWILGVWTAWIGVSTLVLGPRFKRQRAAFFLAAYGNLSMCIGTALALVVATRNPASPLWMGYVVYACINGTLPSRHGRGFFLLCHSLAPFLLCPVFLHWGLPWSVALPAPAFAAVFSFIGYAHLTSIADVGLTFARERDVALDQLREREAELERQRIARELHDSIGSTLSLVGMYADLVERHSEEPADLRRVSTLVREAASEGLHDLRGVLNALAPHTSSFGALAGSLRRLAQRAGTLANANVNITLEGDTERSIPGRVRLALVRCVQEGVRNALRHGAAKRVDVKLWLDLDSARLELLDDGSGMAAGNADGLGLSGMRSRAEELGGSFEVSSALPSGTQLRVLLPLSRPENPPPQR